jgi:octaheme c-type cytochrome (tetrathionate reductase family)
MRRIFLALFAVLIAAGLAFTALHRRGTEPSPLETLKAKTPKALKSSVDHSLFTQLKAPFKRPQDVTAACLSCHNGRSAEVMRSSHWNWERVEYVEGKGIRPVGKRNVLNNYCIGVSGSQASCDKCHIGYGWANASFDLHDPLNVDCLACHDNSGTYVKASGAAGMPDPSVSLNTVAQHVGKPQRADCGTCHFFGGGGNNVKHGDLEKALFDPSRDVDVHMATDGPDMSCVSCHTAEKHQMLGKAYSVSSMNRNRVACETCHSDLPHADDVLNQHTLKVACQTCHIPVYAKVNPTKLSWDWSTAGKLKDGKPYEEKDANGTDVYMSIKGSFVWGKNLVPEYAWFNGTAAHYLVGEKFDPTKPLVLNPIGGSYDDPDSKIVPVKIHRAKQIYDTESDILIQPKLYSSNPGDGGYWTEFDWGRAAKEGMKEIGVPYSGHYGFARTEMSWPINHMVSPREKSVRCNECHTRQNGRLAKLPGFYMPGRDRSPWVDRLGTALAGLTLLGVFAHGGARLFVSRGRNGEK